MIVDWDEGLFLDLFPQFSEKRDAGQLSSGQLMAMWEMAVSFVDNSETSLIPFDPDNGVYVRRVILFSLVCHLTTMAFWDPSASGAVASASQGGVSASFQIPQIPAGGISAQWYNQTPCGRTAWMLLRSYTLGGRYYGVQYSHPFG